MQPTQYSPLKQVDWSIAIDQIVARHEEEYGQISLAKNLIEVLADTVAREQNLLVSYLLYDFEYNSDPAIMKESYDKLKQRAREVISSY